MDTEKGYNEMTDAEKQELIKKAEAVVALKKIRKVVMAEETIWMDGDPDDMGDTGETVLGAIDTLIKDLE